MNEIPVDRFRYSFHESANFNNGYKPDIVCATCESSDHWSDVCPMMIIPKVENLSHKKASYEWSELERVIIAGYEKSRVKKTRINEVGEFVDRVRVHLQNELKKTVRLHMFGSLISGFGVSNSDVDLCFRFEPDEQPLDIDGVEIVRQIAQHLQQMNEVDKVYAITGAKVPIVKFNWMKLGVEGDISYYNVLALSNTEMLKKYCSWDSRVAPLGVWIKRWAKSCDIGDASRGSLSSYAFIILLLHYLQNCDPPVLPRLQEEFRDDNVQPCMVENCDVYFHREVIPNWSKNQQSVGELFVGFLDYYARFDFGTQVCVCLWSSVSDIVAIPQDSIIFAPKPSSYLFVVGNFCVT
ncbi:Nucleotidyltransferase domain protein [Trichostrongylus colubriformis]|uniref:Nucleotidyltransferase domain protein n=1 Tax=Trichostrongylus colubriformis TaxID=6319 RepID=A0AAN8FXB6_TRICO